VGINTSDLVRVKREAAADGLLGGDFGHHRDVVEPGGNVVEQREQAGGHLESRCGKRRA
jgi:hypothetical protein